jgi:hypothetical protein
MQLFSIVNKTTSTQALILLICCATYFSSSVYGQGSVAPKYSNEFLSLGIGADALGFSNAVVAQTGSVTSGYWNPAGLVRSNKWLDIGLMHSEHFAGIAKHDYLGLSHQIDEKSAAGISIIRFAVDDIPNTTQLIDNEGRVDYDRITTFTAADYAFLFTYARKLSVPGLAVGGNFKLIYRKVGDFAKSWGFGLDAGVTYEKSERLKFGAVVRDATSTFNAWIFTLDNQTKEVFTLTGNEIPKNGLELTLPRIILGTYYKQPLGKKGIYVAGEIDMDITTDGRRNTLMRTKLFSFDPHLGIAFGFKEYVTVRTGMSNMQFIKNFDDSKKFIVQPNLGIGVHFKSIYLDYAFTNIGQSLYSHVISLRLALNKPKNLVKKEESKE